MATEQTRSMVWYGLLDVARLVRYYGAMAQRYRRNQNLLRVCLLLATAGGVATVIDLSPDWARLAAGAAIALVVVWDYVAGYAEKAALLHTIRIECASIEIEVRALWRDVYDGAAPDDEVRDKYERLEKRCLEVTGRAGLARVPEDSRLNEKCADETYTVEQAQYAV